MALRGGNWRIGLLLGGGLLALLILPIVSNSLSAQDAGKAVPTVPVSQWADDFDAQDDIAYGVAVDFRDEAVVVGTSPVVKYSPGGRVLWQADYPDVAFDVATDSLGDVIVAGRGGLVKYTSEGRRLWEIPGHFRSVAVAREDVLVAVGDQGVFLYDPAGRQIAQLAYEGEAAAAAVDPTGRLLVVVGDPGIAQYDLEGSEPLWQVPYPGEARDVAVDSEGAVLVVGSAGVSKYGPRGVLMWQEPFPGEPYAVATFPPAPEGQAEVASTGDFVFVVGGRQDQDWDYSVVKYAPTGERIWEARYDGGVGDDLAFGVAVSSSGYIYVTGTSTLAKPSDEARSAPVLDQDYYTIQYVERPLFEVEARGARCPAGPTADFEVVPTAPLVGEPVQFANRSFDPDGYLMAWAWDFGDGTTSLERDPTHVYGRSGTYPVTLTVVDNEYCVARITREVEVGSNPVVPDLQTSWSVDVTEVTTEVTADFTWTVERGVHGSYPPGFWPSEATDIDVIHFEDHSVSVVRSARFTVHFTANVNPELRDQIVAWYWDFGDGNTSTEPSPTHTYARPGTYIVSLTITLLNRQTLRDEQVLTLELPSARIVDWEWDFGDGNLSTNRNPAHHYSDNDVYTVTLTVQDEYGNTATAQKTLTVLNVPPIADFSWTFADLPLPTCDEFRLPVPPVPGFGDPHTVLPGGYPTTACQEPTVPPDAGIVSLQDLSSDGEPWLDLVNRTWTFTYDGSPWCWAGDCTLGSNPQVLFLLTLPGPTGRTLLYRGPVDVTLTVTDDDGATGEITQTLDIANVPPYAAFAWSIISEFSPVEPACDRCAARYGPGDATKSGSATNFEVTREIYTDCSLEGPSAVCTPWGFNGVWLTLTGSGTVSITETVPTGFVIDCYGGGPGVTVSCSANQLTATVDLDVTGSPYTLVYDFYWDGTTGLSPGPQLIQGQFSDGEETLLLDSTLILCDRVNVTLPVLFYGYDPEDAFLLDPNGDLITSYDWDFGAFGAATGQQPEGGSCSAGECEFLLEDLTCVFDGIDWVWFYDLPVTMTATDEAGGSTEASTTIPLGGFCGGGFLGPA